MRISLLVIAAILFSSPLKAQVNSDDVGGNNISSIIGVVTSNPDDFYKIKNLLDYTEGVSVLDYCFQGKLMTISFNPEIFREENEVFDLITSYYVNAKCYRKIMSREVYNRQCQNELAKQNQNTNHQSTK
ncbi:MAG: hypothetical protein C0592_06530 [Marinilabiliales bacterium]|nr:MAG: hypothetical protein C0592_06530 [Marinilabiliales bacterium]